jgi:predicted lipid-binding transport protein (Tim44 family)
LKSREGAGTMIDRSSGKYSGEEDDEEEEEAWSLTRAPL